MTPLLYKTYRDLIITESKLSEKLPPYHQKIAAKWAKRALNPQKYPEDVKKACEYFIDFMIQHELYHPPLRYQFSSQDPREQFLHIVFHQSFENQGEAIVSLAEEIAPPTSFFYAHFKKLALIQAPEKIARLFQNKIFQLVATVSAGVATCYIGKRCYFSLTYLFKNSIPPFLISKLPRPIIEISYHIFAGIEKIDALRKKNFKILFLLAMICSLQPNILPKRIAPSLKLIFNALFFNPQTTLSFLLETSLNQAILTFKMVHSIGNIFSSFATQNKIYYINSSRSKAKRIWNEMIRHPRI
ncbi:hypothetical protein [Rhabdochlamydiaceae symbiont of Dictyostelium giganteum]|uniref:hypothetical protein n=1 Tax=Rhabdochlamydiaceae symbiont of Dictyostelium giganteum TaxID=3342349 RepID=UPI00384FA55D